MQLTTLAAPRNKTKLPYSREQGLVWDRLSGQLGPLSVRILKPGEGDTKGPHRGRGQKFSPCQMYICVYNRHMCMCMCIKQLHSILCSSSHMRRPLPLKLNQISRAQFLILVDEMKELNFPVVSRTHQERAVVLRMRT